MSAFNSFTLNIHFVNPTHSKPCQLSFIIFKENFKFIFFFYPHWHGFIIISSYITAITPYWYLCFKFCFFSNTYPPATGSIYLHKTHLHFLLPSVQYPNFFISQMRSFWPASAFLSKSSFLHFPCIILRNWKEPLPWLGCSLSFGILAWNALCTGLNSVPHKFMFTRNHTISPSEEVSPS